MAVKDDGRSMASSPRVAVPGASTEDERDDRHRSATASTPSPHASDSPTGADDAAADTSDPAAQRTPRDVRRDRWVSTGIALITFGVYLRSLLPGMGYSGDTAKWQLLGEVGGVPHATGYPLYVALSQAWVSILPWGSVAWRVNLLSTVIAVAAIVVLYRLLRILAVRWEVAAATALTFAFTYTFWTQAVVAEVYTLHILFLVSVTACLARWRLGGANAWLLAGLTLYAISFGHHLTTALALPGVAWLVWSDWHRALRLRNVIWVTVAVLLSACQYLYVIYMSDVGGYVEHGINSIGDVVNYISGGPFKDDLFSFGPGELLSDRVPLFADFLSQEYLVLLAPMAWGVWCALRFFDRPRRDVAVHLLLLGAFTGFYALNFDVIDVIVFLLPAFFALAVFLGIGLDAIVDWITARWSTPRVTGAVAMALLAIPLVTGLVDYGRSSQRGTTRDAARIERALRVADRNAVLLTDQYQDTEFFWYYLLGEHRTATHDLVLAQQVTPRQVREYLTTGGGPVASAAAHVTGTDDPPLYTATPHQAQQLSRIGLTVTEVAPDVWRVEAPPAA